MKKSLNQYILSDDWSPPSSEDSFKECYLNNNNAIMVDDNEYIEQAVDDEYIEDNSDDEYNKIEHEYSLDTNWTIFVLIIEAYYMLMLTDL